MMYVLKKMENNAYVAFLSHLAPHIGTLRSLRGPGDEAISAPQFMATSYGMSKSESDKLLSKPVLLTTSYDVVKALFKVAIVNLKAQKSFVFSLLHVSLHDGGSGL